MSPTRERLKDIQINGYQLDFGNVFNHAFENYKKIALYAGLVLFVFTVLFGLFAIGALVSFLGVATVTENLNPEKLNPESLTTPYLLIYSGIILALSCILSPFQAAFLKMADCGEKDEEFHISTLFNYYQLPYIKEIILSTFLISFVSILQSTLFSLYKLELVGSLITYFLSFITFLTIPLVIFGNLKALEAIKNSILIVSKQPFILIGLLIVSFIGSMVGIMACCVGVFFTIPFLYSMNYAIYHAIVGIDNAPETSDISTDL
jgi:hypothetical protein